MPPMREAGDNGGWRGRRPGRGGGRGRGGRQGNEREERERGHTPPPPPPPQRAIEELFLKQNPPTFNGSGNSGDAELWVRAMERIFNFLRCTDKERLSCVLFQLTGPADFWWEARRKLLSPEHLENYTWEEFKEALYDKYIPRTFKMKKEAEFYNLKKGKMSMTDYDRMFCELVRYAPDQVDTDEKMAAKFRSGLRHEIGMSLASHGRLSYTESLNRAQDIEAAMPEEKQAPTVVPPPPTQTYSQGYKGKRKWEGGNNGGNM